MLVLNGCQHLIKAIAEPLQLVTSAYRAAHVQVALGDLICEVVEFSYRPKDNSVRDYRKQYKRQQSG